VEILIRLFSPRSGGMTLILPRHSRALRSAEPAAHSQSLIERSGSRRRNLCCCQRPLSLKEQSGERPQCPGHHSRALARFWNIPRRFTLVNRRSPLASPQSSGKLQELTFDVSTLLPSFPHRNRKHSHPCEQPVDDAPSLWKLEEKWKINPLAGGSTGANPN